MKKFLFSLLALISITTVANSQLRVISNGNVQVGNWVAPVMPGNPGTLFASGISLGQTPDTLSTMAILGPNDQKSGGYISFGARKQVSIGESTYTQLSPKASLLLKGEGGIEYKAGSDLIFSYQTPMVMTQTGSFVFKIPVSSTQYLTTSDARKKKNIESLDNAGALLDNLTPVKYQLSLESESEEKATKASAASEETPVHFGFIAQEVREIYPELVYEDEEGMLSIDYNGFIPLVVDALKDLKAQVAEQQEIIKTLTSTSNRQLKNQQAGMSELDNAESITLSQNKPNPFRSSTEISCYLPESVGSAFICIYDLNGRQQQQINIEGRGDVTVTISGNTLAPGMYIYSLIADGQEADTKRMILTE